MPFLPASLAPWRDRNGRLSLLRVATLVVLVAPLLWLAFRTATGDLGPRPLTESLRFCGARAIETLIASIAVTPLRRLAGWSKLVGLRRMIGVTSFLWTALHLVLYAADQAFDMAKVATEIAIRPYLTMGFVAFVGLLALTITSTDGSIRRLGGARWGRLHGLVHPIAILGLAHYFLQIRLDPAPAAMIAGLAIGGLAVRVAADRGEPAFGAVAAAAVFAALGAAGVELFWFAVKTQRPLGFIAAGNLDWADRLPASATAGLIALGLGLAAVAKKRREMRSRSRDRGS